MKFVSSMKYLLLGATVLGLVACSSMGRGGSSGDDIADDGAYSMGVGDSEGFGPGHRNSTNAPENQVYYFEFDSSEIASYDQPAVEAQARYLSTHPKARVVLEGHTDERGSREYNIALGERRALSVADLLKINGASEKQIRVVSYGEEKPADPGHTEEAYRMNRRVKLVYEVM